uniref:Mortality factor 4-like protein 1 n=1 Tax=Caligus clemensi TaxID=344056 RepID=C1C2M6_CALCM|nr:Mortality factor 4-like protein 1 [Caligus clemensi]
MSESEPLASLPPAKFKEGEKILCFHGPLIYEAKVQKLEESEAKGRRRYFIHYHGWSKNWDEWVLEPRMLKHNEGNLIKKRELIRAHEAKNRAAKKNKRKAPFENDEEALDKEPEAKVLKCEPPALDAPSSRTENVSSPSEPPNSTADDEDIENESEPDSNIAQSVEQTSSKVEVRIKIPEELKSYLVDDWDYLTRQRKLLILPSRITVEQIIQDYVDSKRESSSGMDSIVQVTNGLKEYFNVMLGSQLLYRFEREQYADILKEHGSSTPMSKIYGAVHLLRLFVKLCGTISLTSMQDTSVRLLMLYAHDFLDYMKNEVSTIFSTRDYGTAPPEYHRRSL